MRLKYCNAIGCNKLISANETFCKQHRKDSQLDRSRRQRASEQSTEVYNSKRWEDLSRDIRRAEPFCEVCVQEWKQAKRNGDILPAVRLARAVHHKKKIRLSGEEDWFDRDNLIAVCDAHHKELDRL
jgi:hypothetical protein